MVLLIDPLMIVDLACLEFFDYLAVLGLEVGFHLGEPVVDELCLGDRCNERVLVGQVPGLLGATTGVISPVEGRAEVGMEGDDHFGHFFEPVPNVLLFANIFQPSETLGEHAVGLHPNAPVLVEDGQADQLLLGGLVDVQLVGDHGFIDQRHCVLGQKLVQLFLSDYFQLEGRFFGDLFKVLEPQLGGKRA